VELARLAPELSAFEAREDLKTQVAAYFAARKTPKIRRAKRTKAIEHTKAIEQK
jgi:hypothetical protein